MEKSTAGEEEVEEEGVEERVKTANSENTIEEEEEEGRGRKESAEVNHKTTHRGSITTFKTHF